MDVATSYAALILAENKLPVTAESLNKLCQSADVKVPPFWFKMFEKTLKERDVEELILSAGAGPATSGPVLSGPAVEDKKEEKKVEVKKEEPKEESDDAMEGFGLFD